MNKFFRMKRGEGYVDVCVGIVIFVMLLVTALNLFSFMAYNRDLDAAAEELLDYATYSGAFGSSFARRVESVKKTLPEVVVETSAESYFNASPSVESVQLGQSMTVKVYVDTFVKGLGIIKIPVRIQVSKTGLSEKYWKQGAW